MKHKTINYGIYLSQKVYVICDKFSQWAMTKFSQCNKCNNWIKCGSNKYTTLGASKLSIVVNKLVIMYGNLVITKQISKLLAR